MAQGRFKGLSDAQWEVIRGFLPYQEWNYVGPNGGRQPKSFRAVFNSIFWILITGAKWADLPQQEGFAPRTTAHRWFREWSHDGTLQKLADQMVAMADLAEMITWEKCYIDGSFSPREGWGRRSGRRLRAQGQGGHHPRPE